jgi:hypothetical protein
MDAPLYDAGDPRVELTEFLEIADAIGVDASRLVRRMQER